MKITDTIRRAGRNLRQAKMRTLLTAFAISVGAFTIMLSFAAGQGARNYVDGLISSNIDPKELFIVKDKSITGGPSTQSSLKEYDPNIVNTGGRSIKLINQDDITQLEARSDIENIRPIYDISATYLTIEGFDKKYSHLLDTYSPTILSDAEAGQLPPLRTDITADSIVVPSSLADSLKVPSQQLIGKTITLTFSRMSNSATPEEIQRIVAEQGVEGLSQLREAETLAIPLKVVAVTKPSQLTFTTSGAIQIPISVAKQAAEFTTKNTAQYQKYLGVTAKVVGDVAPEAVKANLEKAGFFPQTANDLQGLLFTIINVILGIVAGFGAIALFASIFGVINTQYISVLERTSQIGLMKALGMRRKHVSRLFMYEAAWIGFLGGLIGVGAAWLLGTLLNPWIADKLDLGEGTNLLIFVPWHAAGLILGLIIIAIVAGYFPSRKAAKLDPIEALRTE